MTELQFFKGNEPVLRTTLHGQVLKVGASPANDIALPGDDVPSFLCSFEPRRGGYHVMARAGAPLRVGSRSGDDLPLQDGDVVDLGPLTARFTESPRKPAGRATALHQRTGLLRTGAGGKLERHDLRLRLDSAHGGRIVEIPAAGLRVGAHEDNDLVIDDTFVSSFHAVIYLKGERLFVRDLDSTNGTRVQGVRVMEAEVPVGGRIHFGSAEIHVESTVVDDAPVAPPSDGPWRCHELITADPAFAKTFALIEKVAAHDATVCVLGETGSGKELVAHAVHALSARASKPFVPLNCAAIPSNLIESMLFGHEKGAFTGAERQHLGVFEEAHEGTLFLDEIGELPLEMQAKLLRVLETRLVRRLGGRHDIPVDIRLVTATHRDLAAHVAEGRFREDLLHRLYVIPVNIPPLRARRADVAVLARHFAEALSPGGEAPAISPEAQKKLEAHPFPGNVRELKNTIQRALILRAGARIEADDVQFIPSRLDDVQAEGRIYRKGMTLEDIERQAYREVLASYESAAAAARALGIPKTTLWRRATALGVLEKGAVK